MLGNPGYTAVRTDPVGTDLQSSQILRQTPSEIVVGEVRPATIVVRVPRQQPDSLQDLLCNGKHHKPIIRP
jgi:hypothetical protein